MRHLGGDRFLLSVLHDEHAPSSVAGDPQSVANGNNWRFWSYDRGSGSASVLEGIDWNSGGAYALTHPWSVSRDALSGARKPGPSARGRQRLLQQLGLARRRRAHARRACAVL